MSFTLQPTPPARPNRCQLFGPGSRPALFEKMAASAADVINLFPTPDNQYAGGWFTLESGQALVVTVQAPDCRYWSVHLLSPWLESIDPPEGTAIINKRKALP
ncbi:MAG: hypothetical protein AAGA78_15130, partial [Pseudomonadota bacterium]